MDILKKYIGVIFNILLPIISTILIVWLFPKILSFFMPFVIGIVIAFIASPLVRFLEKKVKIVRHFSSIVIIVGAIAFIVLIMWLIAGRIIIEAENLLRDAPNIFNLFMSELKNTIESLKRVITMLPQKTQSGIINALTNFEYSVSDKAADLYSPAVNTVSNFAKSIPDMLVYTIITVMSAYFILAEWEALGEKFKMKVPKEVLEIINHFKKKSQHIVGGYFVAQFRIMFVIGVILAIALTIAGVSYSGLVAFLIAIIDFLPIFGTGTILIPWAIIKFINGKYAMAVFFIALYGATQLVRQLIQPKLLGDSMGLSPLLTLLLLHIGYKLNGFTGMILAVPVGMIFIEIVRMGFYDSLIDGVMVIYDDIHLLMKQARKNNSND